MLKERDRGLLRADLPDARRKAGDDGTIFHVDAHGAAFEIQFLTPDGRLAVVRTVAASQIRPFGSADITHARELRCND